MPSAYPDASEALERILQRYTLRATSADGEALTSKCGLSTSTVAIQRNVNGRDQLVRAHILSLPHDVAFALTPEQRFTIDEKPGRKFVVIGPYDSNLNLTARYTVTEPR